MSIISKIERIFTAVLTTMVMTATLAGCEDEFLEEPVEIPDAEVEVRGEVFYKPLVPTKVQTRAEAPNGAEYKGIKSLYVFFFDSDRILVEKYSDEVKDFTNASSESTTHECVTFKKKVKSGRYYVYAVANIPDDKKDELKKVKTIEELRKFKLNWDNDISKDLEMFGVFKQVNKKVSSIPDNEDFEADELITITPQQNSLLSWVRRAVSKVTIDFDGTNLKDGVTVYIKNAVLKNLPSGAFLGAPSRIVSETDTFKVAEIKESYFLTYGKGDVHGSWPSVTKHKKISPSEVWSDSEIKDFHDDNARALPCYENLQGEPGKSKLQDKNEDGIIDSDVRDGVENGTYLEVEGYYEASMDGYKSQGDIIYRFMLGQNAKDNFDVVRNHHYKITMMFKGYGNDVDWHIEYSEKYLDITYPEDVNYQGRFFTPDADFSTSNGGHAFTDKNIITVTSFATDGKNNTWIEPQQIEYTYYKYDYTSDQWLTDETADWLKTTYPEEPTPDNKQKQYTFVASKTEPEKITMNSLLSKASAVGGTKDAPYNLSNKNGGTKIENTANCYIVGAPGWYCFPLVYGNAITDGATNEASYASPNIVNHLNKKIKSPYIKKNDVNISKENVSVEIIWRDDENIVKRATDGGTLEYDENLFNGNGGIKFQIDQGNIKECNFVIALIDKSAEEDELVKCHRDYWPYNYLETKNDSIYGSTKAIWSWHIWVTRFGFEEFGKDIPVVNHEGKKFDVMPVNLGWCSGDREFRYYKPRKCVITFTVDGQKIERTIEQYPHLLLPRGNHPYYQWGRKDPFVGTDTLWNNKYRWSTVVDGTDFYYRDPMSAASHPTFLYYNAPSEDHVGNTERNARRKNTIECLHELIKNPDKWHNCKHETSTEDPNAKSLNYYTINESPDDLWLFNGNKTVYDPCPSGYEVGKGVFSGFTTDGQDQESTPGKWNDVLEDNMEQDYYDYDPDNYPSAINSYVIELYTDTRKLQSITFPITGYRDWDAWAEIIHYAPTKSQLLKDPKLDGRVHVWSSEARGKEDSYYLSIERTDIVEDNWKDREERDDRKVWIDPRLGAPNTNGMAVRPVTSKSMKN